MNGLWSVIFSMAGAGVAIFGSDRMLCIGLFVIAALFDIGYQVSRLVDRFGK